MIMINFRCFFMSVYDNFFIFLNMDFFDILRYQRLIGFEFYVKFLQFEIFDEYMVIYELMVGFVDVVMGNVVYV